MANIIGQEAILSRIARVTRVSGRQMVAEPDKLSFLLLLRFHFVPQLK